MEEGKTLDLADAMRLYGQLSNNKVEQSVAEQFARDVKKAVARAQLLADGIINSLTGTKRIVPPAPGETRKTQEFEETPADLDAAKGKLLELASSVPPVVKHWQPFLDAIAAQLGVDLANIEPSEMVPDSDRLKKQLDDANRGALHYQAELNALQAEKNDLENRLRMAGDAVDLAGEKVKDAQAALGDAVSKNAALEKQLAATKDPEAAYNRYNEQGPNPWKSVNGTDVPKWAELPNVKNGEQVMAKWRAAVGAVIAPPPPKIA
jgi:hypothetical protein